MFPDERRAFPAKRIAKATARGGSELVYPKLVDEADGQPRIREAPPTIFHPDESRYPWVTGPKGRQFYLRQLRDVKVSTRKAACGREFSARELP